MQRNLIIFSIGNLLKMVRSLHYSNFRAPWPLIKKGAKGWRKMGPILEEKHTWPSRDKEFPELNPKIYGTNPKELRNYTHVKPFGYEDPITKEYVVIKEMQPELIVPDLTKFTLRPYVSYKVDEEIEKRRTNYLTVVRKHGSEEMADLHTDREQRWPPPKMTPRTLFDLHYADKIRKAFKKAEEK